MLDVMTHVTLTMGTPVEHGSDSSIEPFQIPKPFHFRFCVNSNLPMACRLLSSSVHCVLSSEPFGFPVLVTFDHFSSFEVPSCGKTVPVLRCCFDCPVWRCPGKRPML